MDVKSRKAEQADETRKALLRVAIRLFAEKGYAGTAIEEVVRQAGVTKGALYHHFRDKPALFEAVVAKKVRSMGKKAGRLSRERVLREGAARRGWERLVAAVDFFLDQLRDPEARQLVLVDGPAVLGRERWDEVWVENSLVGVRRVLEGGEGWVGIAPHRIEPLARFLLGGLQEAAHTIEHSHDPEATRREFTDAMLWALSALHRQAEQDARGRRPAP